MRFHTVLLLLLLSLFLSAQTGNPATAGEASLREQFNQMLEASNRYQQYKVVRQDYLDAFMGNIADSISTYTRQIDELNGTIATQKDRLVELTGTVEERDLAVSQLESEKDGISLLGIPMSKTTYSILLWSAIIGLLAFALLALGRMRVAVADSREMRQHNEKVTRELEDSRKQRLSVEQKLRRQLQDEINKNRG